MLNFLLQNLTGKWQAQLAEAGIILEQPLSIMQVGGVQGKARKINFLVFNSEAKQPTVIMKLARSTDYQERLEYEHKSLNSIWKIPSLQESIPQPLGLFHVDDHIVIIEAFLPGTSLAVLLQRHQRLKLSQMKQDISNALMWLKNLQIATKTKEDTFSGREVIEKRLQRFQKKHSMILPLTYTQDLLAMADNCQGVNILHVGSHGDFWPGNLLIQKDKIGVIDWEDFNPKSWLFNDLFLFVVLYAQRYRRANWRRPASISIFKEMFLEKNWFSQIFIDNINIYLDTISFPNEFLHLFFSLFLLERAAPTVAEGKKRQEQTKAWQERLLVYANNAKYSVFLT